MFTEPTLSDSFSRIDFGFVRYVLRSHGYTEPDLSPDSRPAEEIRSLPNTAPLPPPSLPCEGITAERNELNPTASLVSLPRHLPCEGRLRARNLTISVVGKRRPQPRKRKVVVSEQPEPPLTGEDVSAKGADR